MSNKTPPLTPHTRRVSARHLVTLAVCIAGALVTSIALTQQQPRLPAQAQPPKKQQSAVAVPGSLTFNTVITKIKAGKQVFSKQISNPDLEDLA